MIRTIRNEGSIISTSIDDKNHSLAVFIDYENLALGTGKRDSRGHQRPGPLPQMDMIIERLVEKGRINVKRAYCDWQRFSSAVTPLHELGIELIEIPDRAFTGKNSADIRLAVDAMEMCFTKDHISAFVICSGDSDFSPLVAKLKEHGKTVIGVGMRDATSSLLVNNCHEFIFYEDIGISIDAPEYKGIVPVEKEGAYKCLFNAVEALGREDVDRMHASLIKDTIKRKRPDFSESKYGYRNFTALLQEAERYGFIVLSMDDRSGTWFVNGFSNNPPSLALAKRESMTLQRTSSRNTRHSNYQRSYRNYERSYQNNDRSYQGSSHQGNSQQSNDHSNRNISHQSNEHSNQNASHQNNEKHDDKGVKKQNQGDRQGNARTSSSFKRELKNPRERRFRQARTTVSLTQEGDKAPQPQNDVTMNDQSQSDSPLGGQSQSDFKPSVQSRGNFKTDVQSQSEVNSKTQTLGRSETKEQSQNDSERTKRRFKSMLRKPVNIRRKKPDQTGTKEAVVEKTRETETELKETQLKESESKETEAKKRVSSDKESSRD